jgi:hypothetical protein
MPVVKKTKVNNAQSTGTPSPTSMNYQGSNQGSKPYSSVKVGLQKKKM